MSQQFKSVEDWQAEAVRRFGPDQMKWKFMCPSCGHVASIQDWKDAGGTEGEVAFSCIGRHIKGSGDILNKKKPCNYAGGGLFRLNPVSIQGIPDGVFDFAPIEQAPVIADSPTAEVAQQ